MVPPGENSYKINFDGATFADTGTAGMGIIIRNNEGLPMASLSLKIQLPATVIEVEVLAARRALELSLELGFDNVILIAIGDSKVQFKALKHGSNSLAHYGHLLRDILFISSHFSVVDFSFVRQLGNKVAHPLVGKANSVTHMAVWMEDVPPELLTVLHANSNGPP